MCRVRRLLRTLCLELSRLCHNYHHQQIRDHQNGTDAGLGFWVIGLPDFFCIFVRFCCEQAYKSNRFRTYPALRVLPGGNQVDGLPPAFSKNIDDREVVWSKGVNNKIFRVIRAKIRLNFHRSL